MKTIAQIKRYKAWISRGLKAQLPWRLVAGGALGTLFLAVAVGFPFGSTNAGDSTDSSTSAGPPSLVHQEPTEGTQERVEVQPVLGILSRGDLPKDAWRFDPPFYDDFRSSEGNSRHHRQQRVADSIQEVAELFGEYAVETLGYDVLAARLNNYQADGSLSSRDLEHLDREIDLLMLAAME